MQSRNHKAGNLHQKGDASSSAVAIMKNHGRPLKVTVLKSLCPQSGTQCFPVSKSRPPEHSFRSSSSYAASGWCSAAIQPSQTTSIDLFFRTHARASIFPNSLGASTLLKYTAQCFHRRCVCPLFQHWHSR